MVTQCHRQGSAASQKRCLDKSSSFGLQNDFWIDNNVLHCCSWCYSVSWRSALTFNKLRKISSQTFIYKTLNIFERIQNDLLVCNKEPTAIHQDFLRGGAGSNIKKKTNICCEISCVCNVQVALKTVWSMTPATLKMVIISSILSIFQNITIIPLSNWDYQWSAWLLHCLQKHRQLWWGNNFWSFCQSKLNHVQKWFLVCFYPLYIWRWHENRLSPINHGTF